MQYHLLAFAPFFVLAGTALMAATASVLIKALSLKVRHRAVLPISPALPEMPLRSAEILYFPAPKPRRLVVAAVHSKSAIGS